MKASKFFILSIVFLSMVFGLTPNVHSAIYTYSQFDYPGAIGTYPYGMNDDGVIVGSYNDGSFRGFSYDGTTFSQLDYPGANSTYARGINDAGTITGWYRAGREKLDSGISDKAALK